MRPQPSECDDSQSDFFRIELVDLVRPDHPLVKLSVRIDWEELDGQLAGFYDESMGAPAKSTRLLAGLHYLKHAYDLSDEQVVGRWVENPYWQFFCGRKFFEHLLPIDPSSMTRWRNRLGEAGVERMLAATIEAGRQAKVLRPRSFDQLNVDTTVQEKAVAFPTDAKLYNRMRERLVREAQRHGVGLRQSYARVGPKALRRVGRYGHARQYKRMRRHVRKLKTWLGRVSRDIARKIEGDTELKKVFQADLELARRLLAQHKHSKNKIYSIHAPEVECISKGKAHKRYEFGNKVGLISTSKEGFILSAKSFHGNPYDGHTLKPCVEQAEKLSERKLTGNIYADRGYRGHNYDGEAAVHLAGRKGKRSWSLKRWLKRRNAIEPLIGHMKTDGRLDRNHLHGVTGDQINAVLCACGQNLRLLMRAASFYLQKQLGEIAVRVIFCLNTWNTKAFNPII